MIFNKNTAKKLRSKTIFDNILKITYKINRD